MKSTETALASYRAEIDAFDDQIVALLLDRCHVVEQVGALKAGLARHDHVIRPGREATMLRRLVARFRNEKFSAEAAAAIWRLIISASTAIESRVHLAAPVTGACVPLARDYWGSFLPLTLCASADDALARVVSGESDIAILPYSPEAYEWWRPLAALQSSSPTPPRIFACLPFVLPPGKSVQALAVGRVTPEETDDDTSCFATAEGWRETPGFTTNGNGVWLGCFANPIRL